MAYGAGYIAARRFGAKEIVDPRPFAVRSIAATYVKYPKTGPILPAMGYGDAQTKDLEETINKSDVDLVIIGTPIDLSRVMKITKPYQRVRYELQEIGQPTLQDVLMKKFGKKKMMRMFWEALKTSDGRAALGGALNHPPSKAGGFRKEGFWILEWFSTDT